MLAVRRRGGAPLLETLVDDVGEGLVDALFARDDRMCTHDEQVVEVDQRLREITSSVLHASDRARRSM
jgi:hypothetical protein